MISDSTSMTESDSSENTTAPAPLDQDTMPVADLARAVLQREVRPRVAAIRRLAEAALANQPTAKKKKKNKGFQVQGLWQINQQEAQAREDSWPESDC